MSAEASDMSSWLLMGLPGVAYLTELQMRRDGNRTAIGTYLNWLIQSSKATGRYSVVAGNAITIPQFFKNRYQG